MTTNLLEVTVKRIRTEAIDIKSFELRDVRNRVLPGFTPGSHIDVHIGVDLIRQYSLCNGPGDRFKYIIAVKREGESRGGSLAMHDRVREGDVLRVGAPRNNFPLNVTAPHSVLLAGGIGVTPLLSMALHLLARRASFELHYFTRSISHTAFSGILSAPDFKGRVHFHYAVAPTELRPYLGKLLRERREGAHIYLCGPAPFMDVVSDVAAAGWPYEALHREYFYADIPVLNDLQGSFEVKLLRKGITLTVPGGKSIVQVLSEHGVRIDVSCEQGVCGTCLTDVVEGEPDHRDMFLTDEEHRNGDKMTICVSRAKSSRLVLDI